MNDHFWEGGAQEYARVLLEEFEQQKSELIQQLDSAADDQQRKSIQQQLEQADRDYERKVSEIDQSLF